MAPTQYTNRCCFKSKSPRLKWRLDELRRQGLPLDSGKPIQCLREASRSEGGKPYCKNHGPGKVRYGNRPGRYHIDPYYDTPEWRELREATLKRDGRRCQYCGVRAYQADHVIPRSKGGPDRLDNLVACCRDCNKTAGGSLFASFEARKTYILTVRNIYPEVDQRPIPPRKTKSDRLATFGKEKRGTLRSKLAEKNNPDLFQQERLLRKSQS